MLTITYILELLGTVAFAVSGADVGIKKHMDIFGVCILGIITACGGGLLRDMMLGRFPPAIFRNGTYTLIATVVSIIVFIIAKKHVHLHGSATQRMVAHLSDSLGLGTFTVVGMSTVSAAGFGDNAFFTIALGVITGVGGGLLRDMMAGEPPYIFVKHIYACASLVGAIVAYALWMPFGQTVASVAGVVLIVLIRFLAAQYKWSLPRA